MPLGRDTRNHRRDGAARGVVGLEIFGEVKKLERDSVGDLEEEIGTRVFVLHSRDTHGRNSIFQLENNFGCSCCQLYLYRVCRNLSGDRSGAHRCCYKAQRARNRRCGVRSLSVHLWIRQC